MSELTEALQPPSSKRCNCGADITGLSTDHSNKHREGRKHQLAMTPRSRPISTYFRPAPVAGTCTTSSTIDSPDTCSSSSDECADDSEVVDNGSCDPSHGSVLAVIVGRLRLHAAQFFVMYFMYRLLMYFVYRLRLFYNENGKEKHNWV